MATLRIVLFALVVLPLARCATITVDHMIWQQGRLIARPAAVATPDATRGLQKLRLAPAGARDGLLYVPPHIPTPAPLIVMLHGSGDSGEVILRRIRGFADRIGAIVLAPDSRDYTWELSRGKVDETAVERFGQDVQFIDQALQHVFARYPIDKKLIALGGFSDGGSYALSLGLMNGDLFSHVIAFSPGFVRLKSTAGQPQIFLAHGTSDDVLPIDQSRLIARALGDAGYKLEYIEFPGKHVVEDEVAREAMTWFSDKS